VRRREFGGVLKKLRLKGGEGRILDRANTLSMILFQRCVEIAS
jgi:hypothetical protein